MGGSKVANISSAKASLPSRQSLAQIYALPLPIRTFPLPTFFPNNPISLIHLAVAWISQTLFPPPPEPSVVHRAVWDSGSGSVHVANDQSVRALWEQGFFGKGSLSRSEPNWLKREQIRRGVIAGQTSEIVTVRRREERRRAKWQRARTEQEAILSTKSREQLESGSTNSLFEPQPLHLELNAFAPPVGPLQLLALPNSLNTSDLAINGIQTITPPASPNDPTDKLNPRKRPKIVRFSSSLESAIIPASDAAIPDESMVSSKANENITDSGFKDVTPARPHSLPSTHQSRDNPSPDQLAKSTVQNMEHLQLTPEEAFFLVFALGVLSVTEPHTEQPLSVRTLMALFCQSASASSPLVQALAAPQADNSFLINYAVYHHFRALGWVPRAGVKFGVDWLIYHRGPVFTHAEFGIVIIPSFSHPWWAAAGRVAAPRTWPWLHSLIRVLSHVSKSLVLVYVDVPPPPVFETALDRGLAPALRLYNIRTVMVRRWSGNRNRR